MKYSNEEKLSIVARCQQGESVAALSNELSIPRSTLYRWLKSFPTDSAGSAMLAALKSEITISMSARSLIFSHAK